MRTAFKYCIYPTVPQAVFLAGELKEACSLYNAALGERVSAWKTYRKSINYYDQANQLNQLKAMRSEGCLTLANSSCCQDVLRRVNKTFSAFFARCKRGDKAGFPRYRSARRYDSITFPSYGDGCRLLNTVRLRIHGAGHIKIKLDRPLEGTVKTLTIKRQAGRWFAIFSVDGDNHPLPETTTEIGIDLGLTTFAVLSNGSQIDNPRYYRNAEARLRRCQRKLARRKKDGNWRRKAVLLLQRAHAHMDNKRRDFRHKEARKLVNKYGLIAVEDLNAVGLAGGMLAKSVHDAGWSGFIAMLVCKAEDAARRLVKVDARGTSQTCMCGQRVPKTLADRWHDCPACGLSAGRDHVSARMILSRARNAGLESGTGDTAGQPSGVNVEVVSCVA